MKLARFFLITVFLWSHAAIALPSLWLEKLTWPEVDKALQQGYTRILIPTGGVEQGSRHLVLGKHNDVLRITTRQIAEKLGHTLIAPIIAYVPEEAHLSFPGTISVQEETFEAVLEDTVRSLVKHGFTHIYFVGDSGGNQQAQQKVALRLQDEAQKLGVTLASLDAYYDVAQNGQARWLEQQGYTKAEIGTHAGMRDTSEMLVASPKGVRAEAIADAAYGDASGGDGAATKASATIGRKMIALKVEAALRQIRALEN